MESIVNAIITSTNKIFENQARIANNITNISTPGFKSELELKILLPSQKDQNSQEDNFLYKQYKNKNQGTLRRTNQPLDCAIIDKNDWFVIKIDPKTIAYTKNGHFKINSNRQLTVQNHPVLGEDGEIFIPKNENIVISSDGYINIIKNNVLQHKVAQFKLKNFDINDLTYKTNGLYLLNKNNKLNHTNHKNVSNIKLVSGILEDSNVNLEENMVEMISNARKFDMQIKILSMYNENTQAASRFLNLNY
ncbi:flagellar basal-body rod protein FlgF [Buchnera aphidicola]|uniref:Flagellar basal-body rod protein FlgF n=1 Tax=Buchnera aphidicola subsp. Baizongia pistaciae (strain Bp) TaxID=224915 RepID=FLGF_BUCBP|nr:flagellar basal-body rod protein FlgF [Buchnera aphidicola]Q89AH8.2 RecName: Full=Flagellar basal-body rod protein FlgF [Buchnera aphidicola str. Bp (Baizongia pistaciae)]